MTIKAITMFIHHDADGNPMAHGGIRMQDGRKIRKVNYVIDRKYELSLWGDDTEIYECVRPYLRKIAAALDCADILSIGEDKP